MSPRWPDHDDDTDEDVYNWKRRDDGFSERLEQIESEKQEEDYSWVDDEGPIDDDSWEEEECLRQKKKDEESAQLEDSQNAIIAELKEQADAVQKVMDLSSPSKLEDDRYRNKKRKLTRLDPL
ncbi:MAG TPA: hypothetical protein PLN27_15590 [Acidobacteriota bacterium]|nr:hypothetical protein [Acidobacteriota bacterium]